MRLHAIVDSAEAAAAAVAGGATVVQVRLKDAGTVARAEMGRRVRPLAAMLVINDDVEAALRCGADGVHLGQTDRGAARAIAAGIALGISAADVDEAAEAEHLGATYIGAGPVWTTPTKPDAGGPIGLEGLAAICAAVRIPVVAIGGIDLGSVGDVARAGAHAAAVISAVNHAPDIVAAARAVVAAFTPCGGGPSPSASD